VAAHPESTKQGSSGSRLMVRRSIDDILADDDLIEDIKPVSKVSSADRVSSDFEEINAFVDRSGHPPREIAPPGDAPVSVGERLLAIRLNRYRNHPELPATLAAHDRHSLLVSRLEQSDQSRTIDDIFADLDTMEDDSSDVDLFVIRNVGRAATKEEPEYIADRKKCEDFDRFKPILDKCAAQIALGERSTRRFVNESEIKQGDFYILNGVILYVAEMDELEETGKTRRKNARLRVIYDNGTEADLLFRSLARLLYRDPNGRRISDPEQGPLFSQDSKTADQPDRLTGYIYVARAESPPEALRNFQHLYKIGVTTGQPKARVAGAKDDPTFLFGRAVLLKHYAIYNSDPRHIEAKLHAFLSGVCLDIEIPDRFNKPYKPKEWFLVPISIVDEIVERIVDRTLVKYRYDRLERRLVEL
jgi:hypothetical protein